MICCTSIYDIFFWLPTPYLEITTEQTDIHLIYQVLSFPLLFFPFLRTANSIFKHLNYQWLVSAACVGRY